MNLKKVLITCALLGASLFSGWSYAAGGDTIAMDTAPNRTNNMAALQNGAKLFANYCLNCHSAAYMRYTRLKDIGLTEQQIKENLLFSGKMGDTMQAAINPAEAKEWFGGNPPDLTLAARAKASHGYTGPDYLYTYLRTYYRDDTKPTGWNNLAYPNVGMPHVLYELQGERAPIFEKRMSHGKEVQVLTGWKQITEGKLNAAEYDRQIGDLVSFMQWMAEPAQNQRKGMGVWVLLFLGIFTFVAWRLNAAYWKDIK